MQEKNPKNNLYQRYFFVLLRIVFLMFCRMAELGALKKPVSMNK